MDKAISLKSPPFSNGSSAVNGRPTVSIIVVTLNTPPLTQDCLQSVTKNTAVSYELIVVNNSRARAISDCLKGFGSKIKIIQNPKNLGYTKAANQGALISQGEFLCFLNTDTLVPPRWMERLLDFARKPWVGAVGPPPGHAYRWLTQRPDRKEVMTHLTDQWMQHARINPTKSVSKLCGFCWVIPRVVMSRLGFFDENFFFGEEDIDYSYRLRFEGLQLLQVNSIFVYHQRSGSIKSKAVTPKLYKRLTDNARRYLLVKWHRFLDHKSENLMAASQSISKKIGRKFLAKRRLYLKTFKTSFARNGFLKEATVSVMMPVYNAEQWIGEAIHSVLGQTFRNFELIIIDDCSTDKSVKLIQNYLLHPRIRFFQNPRPLGIATTRNRILSLSRGKYIAVCDADDAMLPTLLERFVGFLDSHSEVGWTYADRLKINPEGCPIGIDPAVLPDGKREFERNVVAHPGSLIRKKLILEVGGYDETLLSTEDYDLALKILERADIRALSGEIHYLLRRHKNSASTVNPWAKQETESLLERAGQRLQKLTEGNG